MILEHVTLQNFGLFGGRQMVPLAPPSPQQPVVLVGGLNGAGKTTLLVALQLALYGKLAPCLSREGGYSDFLERSMHRGADAGDVTAVEVAFEHILEGRSAHWHVRRAWSKAGKTIREELEVRINGTLDRPSTERWQEKMEEILPVRLAPLFFFDGEQIEQFADVSASRDLLRTAVHSLLGLDVVDLLSTDLIVLEQRKRKSLLMEADQAELGRLERKVQELDDQRLVLMQEQAHLTSHQERAQHQLSLAEQAFEAQGGGLYSQRKELDVQRKHLQDRINRIEERLRELATEAAPLMLVQPLLQDMQAQSQAEKLAYDAIVLTRVLKERDDEVIHTLSLSGVHADIIERIDNDLKRERQKRKEGTQILRYLGLDEEGEQQLSTLLSTNFMGLDKSLRQELSALEEARNRLVEVDRLLAGVPDQTQVEKLQRQCDQWQRQLMELAQKHEICKAQLHTIGQELDRTRQRFQALLTKVTRSRLEQRNLEEELKHSERARVTLAKFRTAILQRQIERVQQHILESFQRLLHKEQLVAGLTISPLDFALRLYDPSGQELDSSRLSAGERQLLAVSMLWGLARAAGRQLPIVIDTPMGRLDSLHRANLVERYFPFASHQVLLLSTDEEVDKESYQLLKPWLGHQYRLAYHDGSRSTKVQVGYFEEAVS